MASSCVTRVAGTTMSSSLTSKIQDDAKSFTRQQLAVIWPQVSLVELGRNIAETALTFCTGETLTVFVIAST